MATREKTIAEYGKGDIIVTEVLKNNILYAYYIYEKDRGCWVKIKEFFEADLAKKMAKTIYRERFQYYLNSKVG